MKLLATLLLLSTAPATATSFHFSTGAPDGLIATAAATVAGSETETADDFALGQRTRLTGGTITGLIPLGDTISPPASLGVEIYRVFPGDSANPPSGRVPTRVNSPADVAFVGRDGAAGELSVVTILNDANFTALNSVVSGIDGSNPFTGGEGAVSGREVTYQFTFATPLTLDAGQYFFVPQVQLADGTFLWLSAPKPIVAPGTPFQPDLQSWIRNSALQPDWLRIGTDITHQGPFNAAFSLDGAAVPEPATWATMTLAFGMVGAAMRRRVVSTVSA